MIDAKKIADELVQGIKRENIFFDEPMKNHTSFKIGGPAKIFVTPDSIDEIGFAVKCARGNNIPYYIVGNGSNILVGDNGFDGIIINIGKKFSDIKVCENKLISQAGATLAKLSNEAAKNSLTGLEFASGIPGTVGGAIVMNAGAYGGEIKDVAVKTTYMDENNNIKTAVGDEHMFGYRTSRFGPKDIVLMTEFELKKGNKEDIVAYMNELNKRRKDKQPLEYASAGSTFKRPEGYFAGKLIEDAGLKGYCIGDAEVSKKHSGFVINKGNARCEDVEKLIAHIKDTVKDRFGVELECEVKTLK